MMTSSNLLDRFAYACFSRVSSSVPARAPFEQFATALF
jgi:hypothetical protein